METFTLVVWLAGGVPPKICSGMRTGGAALIQQHSKEACHAELKAIMSRRFGSHGFCVPDGQSNAWWIKPSP